MPRPLDPPSVAALLADFPAPWCVAGGWALGLFLGRETRPHADVDIAVFRDDQRILRRHLAGWSFRKAVEGHLVPWPEEEWLLPPVHEVHALSPAPLPVALELLLNERRGVHWVYRRDPRVDLPLSRLILHSAEGLPLLCPEVVLLYKAKAPRTVDESDFEAVRGELGAARRAWLRAALEIAHPGHPWRARL